MAPHEGPERWVSDVWSSPAVVHGPSLAFTRSSGSVRTSDTVSTRSSSYRIVEGQPAGRGHGSVGDLNGYKTPDKTSWPQSIPPNIPLSSSSSHYPRHPQVQFDDPAFSSDPRHHPDFTTDFSVLISPPRSASASPPAPEPFAPSTNVSPASREPSVQTVPPPYQLPPYEPEDTTPSGRLHSPPIEERLPPVMAASSLRPDIPRVGTQPPILRVRSEPPPASLSNLERPSPARRGNSSPRLRRPPDLDKIDELDETDPLGLPWHHGGRYEAIGNASVPEMQIQNVPPLTSPESLRTFAIETQRAQTQSDREYQSHAPRSPLPYRLNLKPGELLKGVPKPRMQQTSYGFRPPLAPVTAYPSSSFQPPTTAYPSPSFQSSVPQHSPSILGTVAPSNDHYYAPHARSQSNYHTPRPRPPHSYQPSPPFNAQAPPSLSPQNTSDRVGIVQDEYGQIPSSHPPPKEVYSPSHPSIRFQVLGSSMAPGIDLPPPLRRSRQDAHSINSAHHRPKRLVMPSPLQPSARLPSGAQPPTPPASLESIQPRATHIPIHESTAKNMLKKRNSTKNGVQMSRVEVSEDVTLKATNSVQEKPRRLLSKRRR